MKLTVPDLMKSADGGGHWVTIKKEGPLHGRHIKIDGSGHIIAGHGIPKSVIEHLNNGRLGIDVNKHTEPAEAPKDDPLEHAKAIAHKSPDYLEWVHNLMENPEAAKAMAKHKNENGKSIQELFKEWGGGSKDETPEYKPDSTKKMGDFDLGKRWIEPHQIKFIRMDAGHKAQASADEGGLISIGKDFNDYHDTKGSKLGYILTHEVGHVLSNAYPNLERHILENPEGALGRFNQKKRSFEGVAHTPEESFADAFAHYQDDPGWLKEKYPKAYAFVEHVLSRIPDYKDYIKAAEREMDAYQKHNNPEELPSRSEGRRIVAQQDAERKQQEAPEKSAPAPKEESINDARGLEKKWQAQGAKVDVGQGRNGLNLSRIVFDKNDRNKGKGTAFMNDLTGLADRTGQRVTLTPSADFGGSVSRLKEFYKRFGFVENKGRNKDLSISETMYREPQSKALQKSLTFIVPDLMKSADSAGHWVTIKKEGPLHGRHIKIDGSGRIIAGHGIPKSVIEHLNNGRLDVHKHTETDTRAPLDRAKAEAANHGDLKAWLTHLRTNDKEANDELAAFANKVGMTRGQLFDKFKPKADPIKQQEAPLDRAKALAKNAKSAKEFADALNGDKEAFAAALAMGIMGRELYREWNDAARADRDAPKTDHPAPEALPDHIEKALQQHERTIRANRTETGTLHSPDTGEQVWGEDQGHASQVDLRDAVEKGLTKGSILAHNHPNGNSFSLQDINFLLAHGLKEIRAVSKQHIHRMQAPEGFHPSQAALDNMAGKLDNIERNVRSDFTSAVNSGKMSVQEAQGNHFHEIWTRAAKDLGFRYERSEWND